MQDVGTGEMSHPIWKVTLALGVGFKFLSLFSTPPSLLPSSLNDLQAPQSVTKAQIKSE